MCAGGREARVSYGRRRKNSLLSDTWILISNDFLPLSRWCFFDINSFACRRRNLFWAWWANKILNINVRERRRRVEVFKFLSCKIRNFVLRWRKHFFSLSRFMALWLNEMNLINLCLFIKNTFGRRKCVVSKKKETGTERERERERVQKSCLRLRKTHKHEEEHIRAKRRHFQFQRQKSLGTSSRLAFLLLRKTLLNPPRSTRGLV